MVFGGGKRKEQLKVESMMYLSESQCVVPIEKRVVARVISDVDQASGVYLGEESATVALKLCGKIKCIIMQTVTAFVLRRSVSGKMAVKELTRQVPVYK